MTCLQDASDNNLETPREALRLVRRGGCFRIPQRSCQAAEARIGDGTDASVQKKYRQPSREEQRPSPRGEGMPYVLISTQIRLESGPTNVGDEYSDPAVMSYLGARKRTMLGNNFSEYHVDDPPRLVLDKLEKIGFRVVSMTGVGQTLVWCLHTETEYKPEKE